MTEQVYLDMLPVMKGRGGPFAGLDVPEFYELVAELFTPEEAALNNALAMKPTPAAAIAADVKRPIEEVTALLEAMADKGLLTSIVRGGVRLYRGERFMPGIFEYQFLPGRVTERDKKIARLIWAYKKAFERVKGTLPMTFPTERVIPVDRHLPVNDSIHTYEQVATYIDRYDPISVGACFCRHAAALRGEDIHGLPLDVCMWFGPMAEFGIERLGGKKVTKTEALEVLKRSEEAGLVHMSRNTSQDIDFICNCDRWHCEVITRILKQPRPGRMFNSGFTPQTDPDLCIACGTCVERCPAGALSLGDDGPPALDPDRCFGCAACASGCPQEAISMKRQPDFPAPPADVKDLITAIKASR